MFVISIIESIISISTIYRVILMILWLVQLLSLRVKFKHNQHREEIAKLEAVGIKVRCLKHRDIVEIILFKVIIRVQLLTTHKE
jgi:hypothetical protein